MSAYLQAGNSFKNHVTANLVTEEIPPESRFYDSFQASLGLFIDENLSISKYIANDVRRERNESLRKLMADGSIPSDIANSFVTKTRRGTKFDWDGLVKYANDNLDGDFQTNAETDEGIRDTLKQRRDYAERTLSRTTASGTLGTIAGGLAGVALDPINVLSFMATPYRAMEGIGVLQNVLRAGGREAIIGATAETAIQPLVLDWKAEIQAPYSPVEAIQNIGFAAGFGFVLGGLQGGIGAVRGRNAPVEVEQDFRVSDLETELDNIIDSAEANSDVLDDAAQSALTDLKELREELRTGAPDGDIQASEHFARTHKQLEANADDSPRFETINFDEFDDTRLDLELEEVGDVEMPVRMEVDEQGNPVFEVDTINNVLAKADADEERLVALRNCVVG